MQQTQQPTRRRSRTRFRLIPPPRPRGSRKWKRIFDEQGVTFWLGSGTCLGVIREGRFIPWDDEMDTASVIGMHGLDLDTIYRVAEVFRSHGFYPRVTPNARYVSVALIKDGIRVDWTCHRIVQRQGIRIPGRRTATAPLRAPRGHRVHRRAVPHPQPAPRSTCAGSTAPNGGRPRDRGSSPTWSVKPRTAHCSAADSDSGVGSPSACCRAPTSACRSSTASVTSLAGRSSPSLASAGRRPTLRASHGFYVPDYACYAVTVRYPGHEEVLVRRIPRPRR